MTYTPIQQRVIDLRWLMHESYEVCLEAAEEQDKIRYCQWRRIWQQWYSIWQTTVLADRGAADMARTISTWGNQTWHQTWSPSLMNEILRFRDALMDYDEFAEALSL